MIDKSVFKLLFLLIFIITLALEADTVKGATLLRSSKGLKIHDLKYRHQLNEAEAKGVEKVYSDYFKQRRNPVQWFNEGNLKKIHEDMFGDIWSWAGVYYTGKLRNIGIESSEIPKAMQDLCEEVQIHLKSNSQLSILEQSARILQNLLYIHPFKNGNGRYARFVSALYLYSMQGSAPRWPEKELINEGEERANYITALEKADFGNFTSLERLIVKYGGSNPSPEQIVENSFFKNNFSKLKRKEFICNSLCFNDGISANFVPFERLPQKSMIEIYSYLIDLQSY